MSLRGTDERQKWAVLLLHRWSSYAKEVFVAITNAPTATVKLLSWVASTASRYQQSGIVCLTVTTAVTAEIQKSLSSIHFVQTTIVTLKSSKRAVDTN
jgi:precorrin isomerase